ncbi:redoxin domain-containing protein [Sphingobacterium sp. DK4209]|uniref:Redoxin domain-containing protein n=1 Tax=Sphingobacterium zhuxiongii TaxID=2662364 RepID=A0A5Q0QF72_9SPHI|nr:MULTISPECIES: TlpA disulfide reductase family protein [unclassified Sphingobacterium]MVZ65341.1 redoxin domain-containing protein [Sphingobacterium sp. DK4209]QGA26428.1 redoxin domain-containing protein [Sphingobacterium sp. dk4302]
MMIKHIILACLCLIALQVRAQDANITQRSQELSREILEAKDIDKKLAIYNSSEVQALFKENKNVEPGLAIFIAIEYINLADKENSVKWMNKSRGTGIGHENVESRFYDKFQDLQEHQFVVDVVGPELDSLYLIMVNRKDADGSTFAYYRPRISYYTKSLAAINKQDEVFKHLSMFYQYCGNKFLNISNYYTYGEALLHLGKHDEAIKVFAKFNTEKIDFSAKIEEMSNKLISKIPNGDKRFALVVDSQENVQRTQFKNLVTASSEINGVDIADKVSKNKYILLDFWGTWCAPCAESHPKLIETYHKYKNLGFEVIGIAAENGSDLSKIENTLQNEIAKQGLPWLQTLWLSKDLKHPASKYIITGYPTKILVDQTGKVIARIEGGSFKNSERLDNLLAELLGDEETKYRLGKIRIVEPYYVKFYSENDLELKVEAYDRFVKNSDLNIKELRTWKDKMAKDLVKLFIENNDLASAGKYHSQIQDKHILAQSLKQLLKTKNNQDYSHVARQILDDFTTKTIFGEIVSESNFNAYSQLAMQLIHSSKPELQDSLIAKYLYPVSRQMMYLEEKVANGDYKQSLSYRFAKIMVKNPNDITIAKIVLNDYLIAAAEPVSLRANLLNEFKAIPDLATYFDEHKALGNEKNVQFLNRLLSKSDVNDKVQGVLAINEKYVLVDFWGSWCIPCRASHPHLNELYSKYKDKGFEIVGVADEKAGNEYVALMNWKTAIQTDNIKWIQLLALDREEIDFDPVKEMSITSFPTKILFDKDRNIIGTYSGGDQDKLDAKLKELFGE